MVTEHRFASPQTNVTKQNKPGRTKRYDCIPLPTESATASNPSIDAYTELLDAATRWYSVEGEESNETNTAPKT